MIINIRGTSGSGKTHLARRLMDRAGPGTAVLGTHPLKGKQIVVGQQHGGVFFAGRYDVASGGCDTMKWENVAEWIQALVTEHAAHGHVVFEGLIASKWKTQRYLSMGRVAPFRAVLLSTPLEECLRSINARRVDRGVTEPVDAAQTTEKYAEALRKMSNDRWAGIVVEHMDREAAYRWCCEQLGLSAEQQEAIQ